VKNHFGKIRNFLIKFIGAFSWRITNYYAIGFLQDHAKASSVTPIREFFSTLPDPV